LHNKEDNHGGLRCNIAIFSESDGHNHTPELLHAAASQRFRQQEVRETGTRQPDHGEHLPIILIEIQ
jgi:hypothetical protein